MVIKLKYDQNINSTFELEYFWFRSCELYFLWGNLRWLLPSEVGRGDRQTHVDLCCGLELLELEGGCQTIWRRWIILSLSWIMRGTGLTKDWNCFSSNWQTWIGNDWIEGPGSKRLDGIECLQKIVMRRGGPQFCWHFWYYNWCKWLLKNEAKCEFSLMYDGSISHVSDFLSYFLDSNTSTSPSTSCIPRDTKKAGKTSCSSIQDSLQTTEDNSQTSNWMNSQVS